MITEELKCKIFEIYPDYDRLYGPWIRKSDGRRMVSLSRIGKKGSISKQFSRLLMEVKINRRMSSNETIDHIDENVLNDDINNLQILTRKDNAAKSAKHRPKEMGYCVWCSKELVLTKDQSSTRARNKAGPFCSRQCSGKYGKSVQ